jgi:hypothetical protein
MVSSNDQSTGRLVMTSFYKKKILKKITDQLKNLLYYNQNWFLNKLSIVNSEFQ